MKLYPILQRILTESASVEDKILNPVTGRKIFVRSALNYPHISSAYKAAKEYVDTNKIDDPGHERRTQRHAEIEKSIESNKTAGPYDHVYHHANGRTLKVQNMHWEDPDRVAYHAHQAELKRQADGPQEPKPTVKSDKPRMKRVIPAKIDDPNSLTDIIDTSISTNGRLDKMDVRKLLAATDHLKHGDMGKAHGVLYGQVVDRYANKEKLAAIEDRHDPKDSKTWATARERLDMIDIPKDPIERETFDSLVSLANRFNALSRIRMYNNDTRPADYKKTV